MGSFSQVLERVIGGKASDTSKDLVRATNTGWSTFDAGTALSDSEIGTLRGYSDTYAQRLSDPLGATGRGIFSRARGALSDVATQRTGAFSSRLIQQAAQSGGNLSPEARAELEASNQRDVNQGLFEGNAAVSNAEAKMTLDETSKLFDRMEGISKTILGVGTGRETQGLQLLLASLGLRHNRTAAIANTIVAGATKGASSGGASGSQPNTVTGAT